MQGLALSGAGREMVHGLGMLGLEEVLHAGLTPSFFRLLGAMKKELLIRWFSSELVFLRQCGQHGCKGQSVKPGNKQAAKLPHWK